MTRGPRHFLLMPNMAVVLHGSHDEEDGLFRRSCHEGAHLPELENMTGTVSGRAGPKPAVEWIVRFRYGKPANFPVVLDGDCGRTGFLQKSGSWKQNTEPAARPPTVTSILYFPNIDTMPTAIRPATAAIGTI